MLAQRPGLRAEERGLARLLSRIVTTVAGLLAIVAIGLSTWQLVIAEQPLSSIESLTIDGSLPATIYRPAQGAAPAVVIAHGFAGSQQIMEPFALTLSRAGFVAITIDFPGHGQNSTPLPGIMSDGEGRYTRLAAALDSAVAYARRAGDGRVALLGHSMGSEAVVRYAQLHPDIAAVVAVSLVYGGATATSPRNLLVVNGDLESGLRPLAQAVADQVAGAGGQAGVTYGDMAEGTARRVVFAPWVEHIGVLFSPTSLEESRAWLLAALPPTTATAEPLFIDKRLSWLGLIYIGVVLLFWPFALLIQPIPPLRVSPLPLNWRIWWLIAVGPALLAPLLLRLLPAANLLPILVGGPMALLFTLYGLLTAAGLLVAWLFGRRKGKSQDRPARVRGLLRRTLLMALAAAMLVVGYIFAGFGLPTQIYLLNYFPPLVRLPVFTAVFAALLPYFLADESLTRRPGAPRGAYLLTKICFIASLVMAIVLNPGQLAFLVLITPLFVLYFAVYGIFSSIIYRRAGTILVGALVNTIVFAWIIAAAFPLVR